MKSVLNRHDALLMVGQRLGNVVVYINTAGAIWESSTHCAHTVHLFYLDIFPVPAVLLGCCPLRCCVAKLLPHFTVNGLLVALYMLPLGL